MMRRRTCPPSLRAAGHAVFCIACTLMKPGGWAQLLGTGRFLSSPRTSLYPTCFGLDLAS